MHCIDALMTETSLSRVKGFHLIFYTYLILLINTVELGILNTISVSERTNASLVTNDSPNVASSDRSSLITPSNGTSTLLQPLPINIRMKTCDAVELDNMLSSVLATDSPCVVSLERPARISTSDRTETNGTI